VFNKTIFLLQKIAVEKKGYFVIAKAYLYDYRSFKAIATEFFKYYFIS